MFNCPSCNSTIAPRTSPVEVVIETRPRRYAVTRRGRIPEGFEIMKETFVCQECADEISDQKGGYVIA